MKKTIGRELMFLCGTVAIALGIWQQGSVGWFAAGLAVFFTIGNWLAEGE